VRTCGLHFDRDSIAQLKAALVGHMLEECVRRQRSSDSLDHRYNPWSFVSGAERIGGILTPPAGFWSIL